MSYLLDHLNPEQRKAAEHNQGPLLVVAGAGTGKTRTLTHRIAELIYNGTAPHNILAITFTNKAAEEMRERIQELLTKIPGRDLHPDQAGSPLVKTFHALGVYMLRRHGEKLGLPKGFTILDAGDQLQVIKTIMRDLGFDPKEHDPRTIRSIISKARNELKTPSEFTVHAKHPTAQLAGKIWERYDHSKKEQRVVDFDDLLILPLRLLEEYPDVCEYYQDLWKYVHIDEYQDTNVVQYRLAEILSAKHKNLCVVGDGDQNIYSWRGASLRNILQFEKDFPGAEVIILEENYRSTPTILEAAAAVIEKNKARVDKTLRTSNPDGAPIKIYTAASEQDEARFVTRTCKEHHDTGTDWGDMAVLFRTNFQSRILEEAFLYSEIPYQVVGTKFFERKEIKDIIAYLQYTYNEKNLSALARIINTPKRGLGKTSVTSIMAGDTQSLTPKAAASYTQFEKFIHEVRTYLEQHSLAETIIYILKHSRYETMLLSGSADERERLDNIKELVTYATRFDEMPSDEALSAILESVALMSDQDTVENDGEGAVRLMTIHAAKGLEFDTVFVVGMEQGLFPSDRGSNEDRDHEEERRLCYVAITRARQHLYLSYAYLRRIFGKTSVQVPSEFLADLPEGIVEEIQESRSSAPSSGGGLLDDDPLDTIYVDW